MIKRKVILEIIFACLAISILSVSQNVSAEAINFGEIVSGSIDDPVQVKTYSFFGNAKDQVLVRISGTEEGVNPAFKLYSPEGKEILKGSTYSRCAEDTGTLPDSGTYQLIVYDHQGDDTGKFSLQIVRINGYTPAPTPSSPAPSLSINIQKSSETAPEIDIKPIENQNFPNTNVLLNGSALSDSGIKSVTVNGQYAGTENWGAPIDLTLGNNNIVIVATGNDGSTTIANISLPVVTPTPEPNSWILNNTVQLLMLLVGVISVIVAIIGLKIKRRHS